MADAIKALTVPYRAGERIIAAGEPGSCLFVVQSGSVRLTRRGNATEGPVELAVLEKGDIFGQAAMLEGRAYNVDADAVTECEVLEVGPLTFEKMLRAHPEIAVRLLRQLTARLDRSEERLTEAPAPVAATPTRRATAGGAADRVAPVRTRGARLVQEDGSSVFTLKGAEMLLGRYDPVTEIQPEIDLGPLDTKRSVSRRHARLTEKGGTWYLSEEGGALNGTFVNGIKLLQGRGAPLADGDVLSLGMVRLVFKET